ncbi:MlaC/ttg2D family ABC transporter substrate-binding protein [Gracilimonas sp. BCB1]|uniref:MlaC/ttg2D family ABC transporter substrate-binding protein n=1 Tax=Gracilimonas sp. BCB1 TaxID=3152362 RepID=UPI0032D96958
MLKTVIKVILLGVFLTSTAVAQQTAEDIRSLLEERDEQIKELVGPEGTEYTDEQRQQLKEIINGVINFEAMAKEALEETYDTISTDKRTEFVDLFATIVRDQSLNKLDIYRAKVTYQDIQVEGDEARVETLAQLENVRTPVNYEMEYQDGQWVIVDMEIDDVSTASSYNRQFQRIINQRGFEPLLESLRKRAARA